MLHWFLKRVLDILHKDTKVIPSKTTVDFLPAIKSVYI